MARVRWRRVALFYGLACAGATGFALIALWARSVAGPGGFRASLLLMMFTPLVAAMVTQRAFGEPVLPPLGLTLHPNRWWGVAWLTPAVLALATLGLGLLLPGVSYSPGSEGLLSTLASVLPADQLAEARAQISALGLMLLPISLVGGLVGGATVNAVAALGEEAGWRGWLHAEFAPLGFWRGSLLTGLMWGLWHAPIILQGYNYPDHPQIGVLMMIAMCSALSPVMALIRNRSGSTFSAALFHGVFNGTAGIPLLLVVGGNDLVLGVTGAAGIAVYSAVCVGLALLWGNARKDEGSSDSRPNGELRGRALVHRGAAIAVSAYHRLLHYVRELRRRKVARVAASYAFGAWLLLQVAEVTFEPLHLPEWALTLLVVLTIAGFPVALVLAWLFEMTPEGIRLEEELPAPQATPLEARARPSIAVLPFEDMSPEQDQRHLCDGIAEETLNRLTRVKDLRVASRSAAFRFRGLQADPATVGNALNVATLLEGSVRKDGDQLRISIQLINVEDGYHLWSQSYHRKLEHIFEIEDEIATQVAEALEVTLGSHPVPASSTTGDAQAYEYYLKGRHYFHRWGLRNVRFAIEMFGRATETDPQYCSAWAALADSYAMICMYWEASTENLAGADRASRKALEVLPSLAEAHVSRGLSHFVHRRHDEAIAEFETALRLNKDVFEAHYFYGRIRFQRGELEQAASLFEAAELIRPDDFQAPILLRQVYTSLGRHDDAMQAAQRGVQRARRQLDLNPDDTRALNLGLGGLAYLGDKVDLQSWTQRSLALDGDNPDTLYNVACGYALIGESAKSIDCLERASLGGMAIAEWAEQDADLAILRDELRFRALLARLRGREPQVDS